MALPATEKDNFFKSTYIKKRLTLKNSPYQREKFREELFHNIPKMMFLLLPVFALILKLVYLRKKRYYYEHFIYSLHVHSTVFLSILIKLLLQWVFAFILLGSSWLQLCLTFYILWYIYRSLRTFYGSTRGITLFKMSFLFLSYAFVFIFSLLFIGVVTFTTT